MLDQIVQDEIGIAGVALGPGRADAHTVMGQLGGVQGEQVHMGIFGQYGNQRTARLFQRQGDRPAAERPGQLDGPDFYGLRCMLQFPAGKFAVGGQHGPEVFLVGPVQADVRCVGWLLLFCGVECGHVYQASFRWLRRRACRQDFVSAKAL